MHDESQPGDGSRAGTPDGVLRINDGPTQYRIEAKRAPQLVAQLLALAEGARALPDGPVVSFEFRGQRFDDFRASDLYLLAHAIIVAFIHVQFEMDACSTLLAASREAVLGRVKLHSVRP